MLIENMAMAFHAIKANKMRSFLTMLGIIIGIGSVISIVSIGDTMRGLFQDLYKDVGITQAYVQIGYWIDDVRMTDYFTLDDLDKIKEVFGDEIAYIDSSAYLSTDVQAGRTKMKFEFTGIDYNYQDVQPVDVIYGRYLNEGDVLGRRKNLVMEAKSAPHAPPRQPMINGFPKRRFTPKIAGSVIPMHALKADGTAMDLIFWFFDFRPTARAAPPCATLAADASGSQ